MPPAIWPSRDGSIEVEGLTASYAPELPPVLKNVSFKILPKEKIGICGRTGASTLSFESRRLADLFENRVWQEHPRPVVLPLHRADVRTDRH